MVAARQPGKDPGGPYKHGGGHVDSSKHERAHLGASVYPWYKSRNHCPIWKKKIVPIGETNPTPKVTKAPEY